MFSQSFVNVCVVVTESCGFLSREGDLRVTRPFVYVREKNLRRFAEEVSLISILFLIIRDMVNVQSEAIHFLSTGKAARDSRELSCVL